MGLDLRNFWEGFVVIFLFFACWCASQHVAEETSEAATLPIRPSSALIGAQWWVPQTDRFLEPSTSNISLFGVFRLVCVHTWRFKLIVNSWTLYLRFLFLCRFQRLGDKSLPLFRERNAQGFLNFTQRNLKLLLLLFHTKVSIIGIGQTYPLKVSLKITKILFHCICVC